VTSGAAPPTANVAALAQTRQSTRREAPVVARFFVQTEAGNPSGGLGFRGSSQAGKLASVGAGPGDGRVRHKKPFDRLGYRLRSAIAPIVGKQRL